MRAGNNEHGGALAMVLMIIVVFTVLGIGLLTMNISATKQFHKKGEQVQARHLAEMGVLHYKAEVGKTLKEYNESFKPDYVTYWKNNKKITEIDYEKSSKNYFIGLCKKTKKVNVIPESSTKGTYILEEEDMSQNQINKECERNYNLTDKPTEIVLAVESTGAIADVSKTIKARVTIVSTGDILGDEGSEYPVTSNPGGGEVITTTPPGKVFSTADEYEIAGAINIWSNLKWEFKNSLRIGGGTVGGDTSDNTSLSVWRDFISAGSLEVGRGHYDRTTLTVGGDFIVKGALTISQNSDSGTKISVGEDMHVEGHMSVNGTRCAVVYGNAYLKYKPTGISKVYVVGNTIIDNIDQGNQYKPPTNFDFSACPKPNTNPDPDPNPDPNPGPPVGKVYNWEIQPGVDAEYL
ncbi:hypothetical protein FITA111629_03955 [Filibacter tadaridae]|uniref:Type 4 fimbrial biogenesis protein PilX N-terminal domain-containing protein n=1 Tax=Filibacter tadaridae TaxID=2483811 RepID=A0A3P5XWW5_9BACL|nr:hypothetical protein [Filibacter tadaridae]VDC32640.1 hypothetical protein FILTAD_02839 [Filibacter tadaridae]